MTDRQGLLGALTVEDSPGEGTVLRLLGHLAYPATLPRQSDRDAGNKGGYVVLIFPCLSFPSSQSHSRQIKTFHCLVQTAYPKRFPIMPSTQNDQPLKLDAVIAGAGFSGIYILHRLRDELKLNVKILEAGSDVGGTWYWNTYPGARVDCPAPVYGFGIEEVWKNWSWSELYPGQEELEAYFHHVDQVLRIKKDCIFNSRVNGAVFNPNDGKWTIRTENGVTAVANYFIPAVGFAAQQYVPSWKGIEDFQGTIHHSSIWPRKNVDVSGKRVAIIGTGSTGLQIAQEWAKEAAETFVFQRTPNLSLPMRQRKLDQSSQDKMKQETGNLFIRCWETGGALPYGSPTKTFAEFSADEVTETLKRLYDDGGFRYWSGGYVDLLLNPEGNRVAYDYWAKRTRERIYDPAKRDLLAQCPHRQHKSASNCGVDTSRYHDR